MIGVYLGMIMKMYFLQSGILFPISKDKFQKQNALLTLTRVFSNQMNYRKIRIQIGKNNWDLETCINV